MLSEITPLILTLNEAPNIGRTLERLTWAKEILVLDSYSTDPTLEIAQRFPRVRVLQRRFDDHTSQWNFGLEQVKSEWVLSLDADYILSDALIAELKTLPERPSVEAFYVRFRYCIGGKPLRAALYPPRRVLFRRASCHYVDDGHTQLLQVDGPSGFLKSLIAHDDRKPLDRWLREQNRYVAIEVEHLLKTPRQDLNFNDRIRLRIVLAPFLVLVYTLIGRGMVLDGWPGWFYVLQRTVVELLISLSLLEARILGRPPPTAAHGSVSGNNPDGK